MTEKNQSKEFLSTGALESCEQLVWMYLDDALPEGDLPKLENMLQENAQYMQVYLDCVQLHADLGQHFQGNKPLQIEGLPPSPVLGSLSEGLTDRGNGPPVT